MFLVSGLILGLAWPLPGALADEADLVGFCVLPSACVYESVGNYCVALIFVMSGLKLKTDEVKSALKEWKAMVWGVLSILVFTPIVSFAVIHLNFDGITELGLGLALFFCMPTTLSSGPIITGQAKGNVAMALLLTTTTNLIGIFTAPLVFSLVVSTRGDSGPGAQLDPVPLVRRIYMSFCVMLKLLKWPRRVTRIQL
jgi:sodium/bile acid cotransporter 7